ncbi:MAG TPA: methyltransferase [Thermomonospora sp.]|nr:methyltransferase [Thermomonospora sp.]
MSIGTDVSRQVVDLVTGAWRTQAVHVAATLRLPDRVAEGPVDARALAAETGVPADVMRRLMRLLVALGVFEGDDATGYRATAVSDALRDRPGSLRDLCLLYGAEFYRAWEHALAAMTEPGAGFERAFGMPLIPYLRENEEAAGRFQRAMKAGNFFFDQVPEVFDFSGGRTVVDVGGGNGLLLTAILTAAPDARGVLVDLDHMVPIAREQLDRAVGPDRARVVGQDFFESVPSGGDVYLLSRVLGDWEDEPVVRLLGNVRRVMTAEARLLVLERVAVDDGSAPLAALWDMHLHVVNGGRQRTMAELEPLIAKAGLRLERTATLPMETTALVLAPG